MDESKSVGEDEGADSPEAPAFGRCPSIAVALVLLLGVGIRTIQYLAFVDMWHDELAVARNIDDRGLADLVTQPLDHRQVAPVGFLSLIDVSSQMLGVSAAGLRFVPWLMSLASLFLLWRILSRFASGWALLAALTLFAVSPAHVWYGSSVKPYGFDVTCSLLLVWLSLRYLAQPDDLMRAVATGLLGAATLLTSFPAVPTAAILGLLLVVAWWRREPRPAMGPLAALGTGWTAGAVLAGWAALNLVDPGTDSFMRDFWADDFPPHGVLAAGAWTASRLYGVFAHSLVFVRPNNPVLVVIVGLPLLLAFIGLLVSARRKSLAAALLLAPTTAGLVAAAAHLLPYDNRLGLHSSWPPLVLAAVGLSAVERVSRGRWRWLPRGLAMVTALPLLMVVVLAARPPYPGNPITPRSVLEDLAERRQPRDRIYAFTQARHDIAFYGRRAGIERWVQGERHYAEPRGYLWELEALRGRPRVWFFWVQLGRPDDIQLILDYLTAIGSELERISDGERGATGAALFDLSDRERLKAATAASFPVAESSH